MRRLSQPSVSPCNGRRYPLALVGKRRSGGRIRHRRVSHAPGRVLPFFGGGFRSTGLAEDAVAFLRTCRTLGLPAALERSRSGNGAHVWLFFNEALPARLARNLGSYLLTETMEGRPDIGLGSYDRLFPNQDTLPKGGFGNLIALPLQKQPRARGNSVFLDTSLKKVPVPWRKMVWHLFPSEEPTLIIMPLPPRRTLNVAAAILKKIVSPSRAFCKKRKGSP